VRKRLFGLLLEEGDKIVAVLGLLETAEGHLGTGNVLLGVLEVLELCQISMWTINERLGKTVPECSRPSARLSACWHRYMRIPRPGRTDDRRDREAQDRSCCPRRPSGYGTARSVSSGC